MTALATVLVKSNASWTRRDYEVVVDYLNAKTSSEMTEADIRLLFRAGDVEERLVEEANRSR